MFAAEFVVVTRGTGASGGFFGGPGGAGLHPLFKGGDVGGGEFIADRHFEIIVANGAEEGAELGVAGDEGGAAVAAAEEAVAGIDSKRRRLLSGAVAGDAVFDEDGADLGFKVFDGFRLSQSDGGAQEE